MQSAIDKIIVYGVANPQRLKLTQVLSNKIKVQTLQFYSSPNSKFTQYLKKIDFQMWAYPDGIKIYNDRYQILNDNQPQFSFFQPNDILHISSPSNSVPQPKQPPQYIYSFVLTDYQLNRTYCTCMIWNQRYFIKDDRNQINFNNNNTNNSTQFNISPNIQKIFRTPKQPYSLAVPKCRLQTMINNPLILDNNTYLVYVPKAMIACSRNPCIQLQRSLLKYYYSNVLMENKGKDKKVIKIPRFLQYQFNNLIKNLGYPKAESIFDSQQSQTIRNIQMQLLKNSMKDIQKDKSSGILSIQTNKLQQFYISALFVLPYDHKNSHVMTQNGVKIGSKLKSDTVFHLPKVFDLFSQYFQTNNMPSLLPLPIPQFIQLWKCLLLQKQIIIFSNSQYKSILLCQFMLYLIQPIKWQNIYIPFLPFHLAHHIDAIGGYLIGMSRIHMDYMLDKFDMKTKVVVDLQHQTILQEGGKQVIQLPTQILNYIQNQLKNILQAYQQTRKPVRSIINYLITNPQEQSEIKQKIKFKQNFIKYSLQIQKIFFHALVDLFNNFIPFIIKKQDGIIAVKTQEYLNILNNKLHRDFMKQISKTMVFIRLCQYHVQESQRCAWVQRTIGQLFVYSHDILSHKFLVEKLEQSNKVQPEFNSNSKQLNIKQSSSEKSVTVKSNQKSKRAYAWKIQDLLLKNQKYNQYIQYLFQKNLKEITTAVTLVQSYLNQQQKKYAILMSEDQFQSFQTLKSIQIPMDFGKKNLKAESAVAGKKDKDQDFKNIYEQIHSQQMKSKKWKKFGEKDEQDLYQEFSKKCNQYKIDKFIIKYLKYMQLNFPESLLKVNTKQHKSQKNKNGLLNWLWDLINPPDSSRVKQQSQIKTKLKRKNTVRHMAVNQIVNLKSLFGIKKNEELQIIDKKQKNKDQNKENKVKEKQQEQYLQIKKKRKKQQDIEEDEEYGENSDLEQNLFKAGNLKLQQDHKRISRTQSDIVVFNPKPIKKKQ